MSTYDFPFGEEKNAEQNIITFLRRVLSISIYIKKIIMKGQITITSSIFVELSRTLLWIENINLLNQYPRNLSKKLLYSKFSLNKK